MATVRRNLVANFAGAAWNGVLALALVPVYVHFMGIEAYGLVGLFAMILAVLAPLDAGLGTSAGRELAALSASGESAREMRDVVRTLEVVYWSIAAVAGALLAVLAPVLATRWVNAERLSTEAVHMAIVAMAAAITAQWPISLYSGALMGLEKQVLLNVLNGAAATFRGLGAVAVLLFISPTIVAFFVWQVIATVLHTAVAAYVVWRALPAGPERPRFRATLLRRTAAFTAGMGGTAVVNIALTQADKAILTKLLPLEVFGYYTLAGTVAANLLRIVAPFQQAAFPRFTQLVALADEERLAAVYHDFCQGLAVLTLPVATIIIVYSREVLWLWTGNATAAANAALLLKLLMAGTAINAIISLPYTLQLASSWPQLALTIAVCAMVVFVPATFFLTRVFGAAGAASVWIALNATYFVVNIALMHRRLLRGEKGRWYLLDVALPAAAAVAVAVAGRAIVRPGAGKLELVAALAVVSLAALAASAAAAPRVRHRLAATLSARLARS